MAEAAGRHDLTKQRMLAEQLQFFEQCQAEGFGGGGIIAGNVANQTGEILVGDLGYEGLESHDGIFFSTFSSGMNLPWSECAAHELGVKHRRTA